MNSIYLSNSLFIYKRKHIHLYRLKHTDIQTIRIPHFFLRDEKCFIIYARCMICFLLPTKINSVMNSIYLSDSLFIFKRMHIHLYRFMHTDIQTIRIPHFFLRDEKCSIICSRCMICFLLPTK